MISTAIIGCGLLALAYLIGIYFANQHNERVRRRELKRKLYEIERSRRWMH